MALDFGELTREIGAMPTVQAGLILAMARVRNAMEAFVETEDLDGLRELLAELDANSAVLADAVLDRTPAQAAHEQRAVRVQQEGSGR